MSWLLQNGKKRLIIKVKDSQSQCKLETATIDETEEAANREQIFDQFG
jgi:hypothetical protein